MVEVREQNEPPTQIETAEFITLLARIVKQVMERIEQDDELEKSA